MKDPAFLFYTKDFYEGTRTMLPEERACYIDLLLYQHQNKIIPLDLKRVKMYCSGIEEATLEATLEAKFKRTDKGWYNEKLAGVISEREIYTDRQSENGKIGQFWKKMKSLLNAKQYRGLKKTLENIDNSKILEFTESNEISKNSLEGSLKALLKHLAIAIANVNADLNIDSLGGGEGGGEKRFDPPKVSEVDAYISKMKYNLSGQVFVDFYQSKNWMIGKNKMKDWKASVRTWESKRKEKIASSNASSEYGANANIAL